MGQRSREVDYCPKKNRANHQRRNRAYGMGGNASDKETDEKYMGFGL